MRKQHRTRGSGSTAAGWRQRGYAEGTECCDEHICDPGLVCVVADMTQGPNGTCRLADGQECDANSECASGFCQFPSIDPAPSVGTCVQRNPAPTLSSIPLAGLGVLLGGGGIWLTRKRTRSASWTDENDLPKLRSE